MNSALRCTQEIPAEKWEAIRDRVSGLPECECIDEPRGNHRLEGYSEGIKYQYELIPSGADDNPYYRVCLTQPVVPNITKRAVHEHLRHISKLIS